MLERGDLPGPMGAATLLVAVLLATLIAWLAALARISLGNRRGGG